jgi:uncharacterized iron-regulated membrane protein
MVPSGFAKWGFPVAIDAGSGDLMKALHHTDPQKAARADAKRPVKKRPAVILHRWLSLLAGLLWLFQAATGVLIVFHWEEDDATISAAHAATDPYRIGRTIAQLAPPGSGRHVSQIWTSAGFADRYDITVVDNRTGNETTIRVTGNGTPIRTTPPGARRLIDTIVLLHQSLLGGTTGRWIMGASGLLLFGNLIFGLVVAWPRRGTWGRVLRPSRKGPTVARHYGWHRAVGLVGVVPALLLVGTGALLAYDDPISDLLGIKSVTMPAHPGRPVIGFGDAVVAARHMVPGGTLAAVDLPTPDDSTYRIRLRAPGEWRRAYGNSFVFVDGITGQVRGVALARQAPPRAYAFRMLAPLHTGEAGSLIGRILVLCLGLWLGSMIVIGIRLWWLRR